MLNQLGIVRRELLPFFSWKNCVCNSYKLNAKVWKVCCKWGRGRCVVPQLNPATERMKGGCRVTRADWLYTGILYWMKAHAHAHTQIFGLRAQVTSGFRLISLQSNTNMYSISGVDIVTADMLDSQEAMRLCDIKDGCELLKPFKSTVYSLCSVTQWGSVVPNITFINHPLHQLCLSIHPFF